MRLPKLLASFAWGKNLKKKEKELVNCKQFLMTFELNAMRGRAFQFRCAK